MWITLNYYKMVVVVLVPFTPTCGIAEKMVKRTYFMHFLQDIPQFLLFFSVFSSTDDCNFVDLLFGFLWGC